MRLRQVHAVMAGYVERAEIPGLVTLVSRNDEVHVEALGTLTTNAGAPMQRDTIFRIASLTKPIAAAAAMLLLEECRLRLDDASIRVGGRRARIDRRRLLCVLSDDAQ